MVSLYAPDWNSAWKGRIRKEWHGEPSIRARLTALFSKAAYILQVVHKEIMEYAELCRGSSPDPYWDQGFFLHTFPYTKGFPGGSEVKASACNAGDLGSIPGSGRSPEEGNGNPLQYSCLENPMDRGAWWAIQSMGSQRVGHDWATSLSLSRIQKVSSDLHYLLAKRPATFLWFFS